MLRLLKLLLLLLLPAALAACDSGSDEDPITAEDITVGTGAVAARGDTVTVRYSGRLSTGTTPFDEGDFTFRLGGGRTIDGFDEGIRGMAVGGKRRITIPPSKGYGNQDVRDNQGFVVIPSGSTLVFEIDLLTVKKAAS